MPRSARRRFQAVEEREAREAREARALAAERRAPLWHRVIAGTLKTVVPLLLLAAAVYGWREITATAPAPERAERARLARLVEVVPAMPATQGPLIEAWGEVRPAQTLSLSAEMAGMLVALNPALRAGGEVAEGEMLFMMDDRELALAVAEAEARIAQIDARIAVERGQAARAAKDLARVPATLTDEQRALVLREPQMAELTAERAAAVAARDRAEVARDRALMRAPFDAVVMEETLSEGRMLAAGAEVAQLAALDAFEVHLAVPVTALDWIGFGPRGPLGTPATVRLTQPGVWPEGAERTGVVERRAPGLRENGRMAEVIVRVPDPLGRIAMAAGEPAPPPLLIGSFLRAEIEGRAVENAVRLPRSLLHDDDTIWVMTPEDTLEIRQVDVAWRGADWVLVAGSIRPGERIVSTEMAIVADGMALRLEEPEAVAQDRETRG